jgi:purine-binding chemotaxis protein CheW
VSDLIHIARVAGERVALLASTVEAVVEIEGTTGVPGAAPHIAGLSALRSRVVTVVDCEASIHPGRSSSACRAALLAVVDGHPYALLCETVEDVVTANGEPRPLPGSLGDGWSRVARACVEAEGDLLLLLDVPALVAGPLAEAA